MKVRILRDRNEIYNFLSARKDLHLYGIGDLDDFFWPYTLWYGLCERKLIKCVALHYRGMDPNTLLVFHEGDMSYPTDLLIKIKKRLPGKFNAHFSPGLIDIFGRENILEDYGRNYRMVLTGTPEKIEDPNIRRLDMNDLPVAKQLYDLAYPGNWFDSRMMATGKYFGYFTDNILAGVAGIHVWSAEYRIAALGNIVTHPGYRGRKIAYKLTSALCNDLLADTDTIGLNVKSDNEAAIKCYRNAGFEIKGSFDECLLRNS